MKLKKMLQDVFATEGQERVDFAKKHFDVLSKEYARIGVDEQNMGAIVIEVVKLFLRVDERTSYEEYTFLSELLDLNMTYDEFRAKLRFSPIEDYREAAKNMVHGFTHEGKESFCYFGLCLLESDEAMNDDERQLFEDILEIVLGEK